MRPINKHTWGKKMKAASLDETISFLIARICKTHRVCGGELLSDLGLHSGQEMILQLLWLDNGQTPSMLAERLGLQLPTVLKMIKRMESAGLLERKACSLDRRVTEVYLNERGMKLRPSVEKVWGRLEEKTTGKLSHHEEEELRRLLSKVYENLHEDSESINV